MGAVAREAGLAGTFQDPRYLYMVLEYVVGGEFFTHLRNAQRLDNNNAKFYAAQVSLIFEYLHSQVRFARALCVCVGGGGVRAVCGCG